jgi:hypothetical protein
MVVVVVDGWWRLRGKVDLSFHDLKMRHVGKPKPAAVGGDTEEHALLLPLHFHLAHARCADLGFPRHCTGQQLTSFVAASA